VTDRTHLTGIIDRPCRGGSTRYPDGVSRRSRILALSLVALLVMAGTVYLRSTDDASAQSSALGYTVAGIDVPAPTTTTTAPEPPGTPTSFTAAHAAVPSVALFETATSAESTFSLPNPTHENMPLAFLVREEQGSRYRVALPMRPNGSEAWIDKSQVVANEVPNHILVEVGARRLTVLHGDEVVMATNVAVGKDATPTPLGNFFVDISVAQDTYTPWILSVAGFSDALSSFGGGIGQIAIHGWSDTSVLGQNVSNGCVRVSFDDLWRLRDLAPVGTPVAIVA